MILGKVTGTVVATQKDEKLVGSKLLIVQDVNLEGELERKYIVAVDAVGAGIGEIVLVATGSSARQTNATSNKPVDGVVMAIVDTIEISGEVRYMK
ncbi:MAG: EutN/CcmL family microcompartment protein [Candidatus Poribacteria bacterium]|nr:EutN/CcmL family microcompartment protein [Candidatus Poribacteria bacterium]